MKIQPKKGAYLQTFAMNETVNINPESEYITHPWTRNVVQPVTLTVLITAIFISVLTVINLIVPFTPWMALVGLIAFTALEAIYTSFWVEHPDRRPLDRTTYRFAEFGVLMVITRIFALFASGQGIPTLAEFRHFLRTPLDFFLDGYFLVALLLVFFAWRLAINQSRTFQQLAISQVEARFYSLPPQEQARYFNDRPMHTQRSALVASFFRFWVWGGVVMIIATAMSTVQLSEIALVRNPLALGRLGLRPSSILALITYFLAGFWLVSQGRLQVMNARWLINGVKKEPGIESRWYRSSLLLLLGIALAAAFVPVGSTLPISRILRFIVNIVAYGASILWYLITLFIFSILLPLFNLFRGGSNETPNEPPVATPPPLREAMEQQPLPGSETSQLLFSSFFWTVIIFLAVSAFLFFLRERGVEFNGRTVRNLWQRFTAWLQQAWSGFASQTQTLRKTIRRRSRRPQAASDDDTKPPWRFVRVNALPPREQVRYFYLSVVRRAGETGVSRRVDETPLEYVNDLKKNWPEHEAEIEELTQAFLAARYSPQPVNKGFASTIKSTWKKLRSGLRKQRGTPQQPPDEPEV